MEFAIQAADFNIILINLAYNVKVVMKLAENVQDPMNLSVRNAVITCNKNIMYNIIIKPKLIIYKFIKI